jgi:hypothetical protein
MSPSESHPEPIRRGIIQPGPDRRPLEEHGADRRLSFDEGPSVLAAPLRSP